MSPIRCCESEVNGNSLDVSVFSFQFSKGTTHKILQIMSTELLRPNINEDEHVESGTFSRLEDSQDNGRSLTRTKVRKKRYRLHSRTNLLSMRQQCKTYSRTIVHHGTFLIFGLILTLIGLFFIIFDYDGGTIVGLHTHTWFLWLGLSFIFRVANKIIVHLLFKSVLRWYYTSAANVSVRSKRGQWRMLFYFVPIERLFRRVLFVSFSLIIWLLLINYMDEEHISVINILRFYPSHDGEFDEYDILIAFYRLFLCVIMATYALFFQNIFVRWITARAYLLKYFDTIEKLCNMERLLSIILDRKNIFTPNLTNFLITYPSHPKPQTYFETSHIDTLCLCCTETDGSGAQTAAEAAEAADGDTNTNNNNNNNNSRNKTILENNFSDQQFSQFKNFSRFSLDTEHCCQQSRFYRKKLKKKKRKNSDNISNISLNSSNFDFNLSNNVNVVDVDDDGMIGDIHIPIWYFDSSTSTKSTQINKNKIQNLSEIYANIIFNNVARQINQDRHKYHDDHSSENILNNNNNNQSPLSQSLSQLDVLARFRGLSQRNLLALKEDSSDIDTDTDIDESKTDINDNNDVSINGNGIGIGIKNIDDNYIKAPGARNYLTKQDFKDVFRFRNKKEVKGEKLFKMFDDNRGNDELQVDEMVQSLVSFFSEILNGRRQFESYKDILDSLQNAGMFYTHFLLIFLYLIIFEFNFYDAVSVYASLVVVGVYFGSNPITNVINGVTLIFTVQPYNVGDMIVFPNETKYYVVEKITYVFLLVSQVTYAFLSCCYFLNEIVCLFMINFCLQL